jgi:imidazolonepropionase-like amidohydrolase
MGRLLSPLGVAGLLAAALVAGCERANVAGFLADLPAGQPLALAHVRVIDGLGSRAVEDQTLVIDNGRIAALGAASAVAIPPNAHVLDLTGRTVFPGLVGMHDHLFYHAGGGNYVVTPQESFAMLYLASGVTTIRTAGAVDFAGDIRIKKLIDDDVRPGPTIYLTGPYLNALSEKPDPARIAREVTAAADQGATSFKAYQSLRHDELLAAIITAHARGLKVTGHLCAVGFQEAAELGIDNIEHGLLEDSELAASKRADYCPDATDTLGVVQSLDVSSPIIQRIIAMLVRRHVAITSTLAIYETFLPDPPLDPRTPRVLESSLLSIYEASRAQHTGPNARGQGWRGLLRKEMDFERAFVAAGGLLVAGVDPTGWGGIVAGYGDQRELELLVDAGFTPEGAIRIASANGAALLNASDIGYLRPGMQADVVVVRGNPSTTISDVSNVEIVFKNGTGYRPDALIAATHGTVGRYETWRLVRSPWMPVFVALVLLLIARRLWLRSRPA